MEKIILLGAGGHCKVVIDALLSEGKFKIFGIIDRKEKIGKMILGFPVIGCDDDIRKFKRKGIRNCFVAIGSIGNPKLRMRLFALAKKNGLRFPNIIHKNALVSSSVTLGEGNYIAAGVIINAGSKLGSQCIINTGAIIEHDCEIGDFVHIAPGALIGGGVTVGQGTHIGIGSILIQGIKIGRNSIIGAGSVVVNDVADNWVVFGNPCRKRKNG